MKSLVKGNGFRIFTIAIALLVMILIGSAIAAIILYGLPKLPEVAASEEIHFACILSFSTATLSTILVMLLALPVSYALSRTQMPGKDLAGMIVELTMSLPYILLGFSLLLIFSSSFGKWLKMQGFKVVFSRTGIVVAQLFVNLPYAIRLIRTAFEGVDPRMEFVAQTLGASEFQTFKGILLPLCKPSLISAFVLTWSRALGEFGATLMLVGVTRMKTETLPGSIYLSISTGNNDTAMATAMLILCISAITLTISNIWKKKTAQQRR